MGRQVIHVADGFWNVRGSFKIAGVVDIGTQMSLVRRGSGKFVFLDAYTLSSPADEEISRLTRGGQDVEAILNLHPFHTVHVRRMHEKYPEAKLYGTARHQERYPELPWQPERTEDEALHASFADVLEFTVPHGVDFISKNENVHFSSVLAFHKPSSTIHVDDTLMCIRFPKPLRAVGVGDRLSFHPTLSQALERRAGAAADFRSWAEGLADRWCAARNLCAAHTAPLTAERNRGAPIDARIRKALDGASRTLRAHEKKYG